jgi:hypothetical protein
LKPKGEKTIFQANRIPKQGGIAILTFDKTDFKPKSEETKKATTY